MNLFQLITLPILAILLARSLIILARGSQPRGVALLASVIWLTAGIAILRPDLTIRVAGFLGIGRGADLVLYLMVISFLTAMFYIYGRIRKLESHITEIVRHLAIRDHFNNLQDQELKKQDE